MKGPREQNEPVLSIMHEIMVVIITKHDMPIKRSTFGSNIQGWVEDISFALLRIFWNKEDGRLDREVTKCTLPTLLLSDTSLAPCGQRR